MNVETRDVCRQYAVDGDRDVEELRCCIKRQRSRARGRARCRRIFLRRFHRRDIRRRIRAEISRDRRGVGAVIERVCSACASVNCAAV